ncbi:MAG: PqqD family protein [Candidatus Electrothrix communis]|nr:PqqD family protein [Desulfobulbus sp. US4]WLE96425.1 MAG: PqqD family protein [Candidatus Electrothrix communis]
MQLDSVFRKADNIVSRKVMDETLLVPISGELASMDNLYSLNETGAFIWGALDGSRPLVEIGRQLGQIYDADATKIEADLMEIIAELSESGLVVETAEN